MFLNYTQIENAMIDIRTLKKSMLNHGGIPTKKVWVKHKKTCACNTDTCDDSMLLFFPLQSMETVWGSTPSPSHSMDMAINIIFTILI